VLDKTKKAVSKTAFLYLIASSNENNVNQTLALREGDHQTGEDDRDHSHQFDQDVQRGGSRVFERSSTVSQICEFLKVGCQTIKYHQNNWTDFVQYAKNLPIYPI